MISFFDFLEQNYSNKDIQLNETRNAYINYLITNFGYEEAKKWIFETSPEMLSDLVGEKYVTYGNSDCNPLQEYVCCSRKK